MTETATRIRGLDPKGRLGFLARDTFLYGGAAALNALFGLVTFPILARHFDVAEYGLVDLLSAFSAALAVLVVLGQDSAVARFYYGVPDAAARRRVVSESAYLQLGMLLIVLAIAFSNVGLLLGWLGLKAEDAKLVAIVLLTAPVQLATNFALNLLKWTFERTRFMLLAVGSVAARMVAICVAVLFSDLSVVDLFLLTLLVQTVFAVYGLAAVRRHLQLVVDGRYLLPLLRYGVPLGVIGVAAAVMPALERAAISAVAGAEQLGIYAAGAKVALLLALMVQAFQTAWGPFSLALHEQDDSQTTFDLVLRAFSFVLISGALALHLLSDQLIALLASSRYAGAGSVVFMLALALAVQGIGWILELGVTIAKRTHLFVLSYAAGLAVLASLVWPMVERFGIRGAAAVVLLAQVARTAVSAVLAQRAWPRSWSYGRTAVAGALALVTWAAVEAWCDSCHTSTWLHVLVYGAIVVALGFVLFSARERRGLLMWGRRGWARRAGHGA